MQSKQFDNGDSLRAQRMTPEEAKAVIDLWQDERFEQTGLTDRPAVPDVAEGLDIGVADVQRLLAEVRTRRKEAERELLQETELSRIQLAEEERRLAEALRRQAELRQEQNSVRQNYSVPQPILSPQRTSLYTKYVMSGREIRNLCLAVVLLLLGLLACVKWYGASVQTIQTVTYGLDAKGNPIVTDATCYGSRYGIGEGPCNAATIADETAKWRKAHAQDMAKQRNK